MVLGMGSGAAAIARMSLIFYLSSAASFCSTWRDADVTGANLRSAFDLTKTLFGADFTGVILE